MTETQFTGKLVKALRERLGNHAVVLKHADGYTAGIPDISITTGRDTLWIEAKLISNQKIFEPLQLAMLRLMEGHYVVWDQKKRIGYRFHSNSPITKETKKFTDCVAKDMIFAYQFYNLVENILNEVR